MRNLWLYMAKGAGRSQVCYVTMEQRVPTSRFKKVELPDEDEAAPED